MSTPAVVMKFRESTGPIDSPWGSELKRIEKRVWESDKAGIRARWESGRHILTKRDGKQLPKGLLKHLCSGLGVSQQELSRRTRFAELCPTEKELTQTMSKFQTWHQIITHALVETRTRQAKRKRAIFRAVVVRCQHFTTRQEIPARDVADLQQLYAELHRLFAQEGCEL